MTNKGRQFYDFGPFRLDPDRRQLLRQGQAIPVQPKALDILLALIENRDSVVLKDDLLKRVWPDTFVEESNLAQNIFVLRKALGEAAGNNKYIVTIPGRGYRFAEKVQVVDHDADTLVVQRLSRSYVVVEEEAVVGSAPWKSAATSSATARRRWVLVMGGAVLLALAVYGVRSARRLPPLNEADLIVISDFVNTTGEPIFDDTLKQAATVKMAESPFFNVVLDSQTRKTLRLMQRSPDERVVGALARDVCQREGAKALINGSVLRLGARYVLDLDATNCLTGASLAYQRTEAANQEQVLTQLGKMIVPVRQKLGESLSSIQKFDTPIEQATTKSLPALRCRHRKSSCRGMATMVNAWRSMPCGKATTSS